MKQNRIEKVLLKMKENHLTQILVTSTASIYYLTGEWIPAGERMIALYINSNGNHKFIVNKLFPLSKNLGIDIIWYGDDENPIELLGSILEKQKPLGIDKFWTAQFLIQLLDMNIISKAVNSSFIIDNLRMQKDEEEKQFMRESSRINDKVMKRFFEEIKEGYTEKQCVRLLADLYEEQGAEGFSFEPIIAFGINGADPHHKCDNTKLKKGHSIVIDIGGLYEHYCSDMTRTVFFKQEPCEKYKKIYEIVKNANLKAIAKVKAGVKFSEIDAAARDYITENGYGEYFTHRTGHSIGIEVHDKGDVSSINSDRVAEGMIFSIEPGIYLNDHIGVRIEDLVMVTKNGCEVLNSVSKEITII